MVRRDWIVATMLDLEATDGELRVAVEAATEAELECVQVELWMRHWWAGLRLRDVEGCLAHLREQFPALDR